MSINGLTDKAYTARSVYVRKGMDLRVQTSNRDICSGSFIPLI